MRSFAAGILALSLLATASARDSQPYFLAPDAIDAVNLLPPPPASDSFRAQEELKTLHQIANDATKAQKDAALADANNETVFLFATVLGSNFNAQNFPATAKLFAEIDRDAGYFSGQAKKFYHRDRPFTLDTTLIPYCQKSTGNTPSYPSGHTTEAFSFGTVLAALVPEKAAEIRARAFDYGFQREICGVHYPTDVDSGHLLGETIGANILNSPKFVAESAAARAELKQLH